MFTFEDLDMYACQDLKILTPHTPYSDINIMEFPGVPSHVSNLFFLYLGIQTYYFIARGRH
jgi:hypothetical protein